MQANFGTGALIAAKTIDSLGNAIANPTPLKFGELSDVTIDIQRDLKLLYGTFMYPVAGGAGKGKVELKAKFARIAGQVFNDLFFDNTLTTGTGTSAVIDTTGTAIPSTPFTITPTIPGSGTWARDLGVADSNGIPMKRVASAPTTGQYSVAAGVYTFAAADTGKIVYINFSYTSTSANSKQIAIVSPLMGQAPTFSIDLPGTYGGKAVYYRFLSCMSSKLTLDPKQDDFQTNDLDFTAFADPTSGSLGYIYTAE